MNNVFDENEFEIDREMQEYLTDLSFDVVQANISEQLVSPLDITVNYLENILDKYDSAKEIYSDNEDVINNITSTMEDFCFNILNEISSVYNLSIDMDRLTSEYDIIKACQFIYEFLVLRFKKNITRFFYQYIKQNKKIIIEKFSDNKKDVTTLTYKKMLKNKDDVIIISNLPEIISFIISLDIDPLVFLDYSVNESLYQGIYMKELVTNNIILGDFVDSYISLCVDEYSDVFDEILANIKYKIIK
jgi:hypothetical protein